MADSLYSYQRFKLAQRWEKLSVADLKIEIQKKVEQGSARLFTRQSGLRCCDILGRTATNTSGHIDWKYAFAARNWIKACLKDDAHNEEKP